MSSTAVRGGFGRFLMTPWMACQNLSCYKNCATLAQAANRTRENFAAVPTRICYAPVWVQPRNSPLFGFPPARALRNFCNIMDSDTPSRVSSRNGQILPSQPLNSPLPHDYASSHPCETYKKSCRLQDLPTQA